MNRKGFAPIILVLVIAGLLVLGGGLWWYTNQQPLFYVISPSEGQIFAPGEMVKVTISLRPGVTLTRVDVDSPVGSSFIDSPTTTTVSLGFKVPVDYTGPVNLAITGMSTLHQFNNVDRHVSIQPREAP